MVRLCSKLLNIRYIMFNSTLNLIFPTKAELPITITALTYISVYHASIKLLVKHSNTKLTRFFLTFFHALDKCMNIAKSFAKEKMRIILNCRNFTN